MFVILVGPKGSGKSHIGRVLEKRLGVRFFHVEPLWMDYYANCRTSGSSPSVPEGMGRIHPRIRQALLDHEHVCVETTGASPEILNDLREIGKPSKTIVARIAAPLELCLERIANRDPVPQIPMDTDTIRRVHALSVALGFRPDIGLDNTDLPEAEIVRAFRRVMDASTGALEHAS